LYKTTKVTTPKFVTKDIGTKSVENTKYVSALKAQIESYMNTTDDLIEQRELFDLSAKLTAEPTTSLVKNAEDVIKRFGAIETPKVDEKIIEVVNKLKTTYKTLLDESRKVGLKIGEIVDYAPHIRTKESFLNTLKKEMGLGVREFGKGSVEKGRKLKGTIEELVAEGIDIFEKNPAIQLAKKGQMYAKAITSQEFAKAVEKFAVKKGGVEVTHNALKDLKFLPEQAKVIDNFYQGIRPEELKVVVRSFDKVQNWWKAQALVAPSYHIRNIAGNLWNNFIAGVNPLEYMRATMVQKNPKKYADLIDEMKKVGVINEGWYAKDIGEEVLKKVKSAKNIKAGLNPFGQYNYLFRGNKAVGSIVENNARIAHYLSKRSSGMSIEKAAESVKKYLFDYEDLTKLEKNVLKRLVPFYTWTRKNLPLQIEGIITEPAKYALPHKIIKAIEDEVVVPNEKFMSDYIKNNIPVRLRTNKEGNTEYFLLGNWLPYASAVDLLSQPLDTLFGMITPLAKSPVEWWSNKSSFFKNTLDEPSKIENRYKQQGEFLGQSMRKKNINLLRNIRILNDMNRWVDKNDPTATKDTFATKLLNTLLGKAAVYDVGKSAYYYDRDTQDRINELEKAIKDARKKGYHEKAEKLTKELQEFAKQRSSNNK
jgi:hypothetical protein